MHFFTFITEYLDKKRENVKKNLRPCQKNVKKKGFRQLFCCINIQ